MWITKVFKTEKKMRDFIEKIQHTHQWQEIFIDNAYGIEYRQLRQL
jgi:hypothetical protein